MADQELVPGDVVKRAGPVDAVEAAERFIVVENRVERVLMQFVCDLPFPPQQAAFVGDVVKVAGPTPNRERKSP